MGQLNIFKAVPNNDEVRYFFSIFFFFSFSLGWVGEERREGGRERRRMAPPNSLVLQVGPVLLTDDIHSGSYDYELKTFDLLKNG